MFIIKYKWFFFLLSGLAIAGSIAVIWTYGLRLGTDFTGGTILEVRYLDNQPELESLKSAVAKLELGNIALQPAGENNLIVRLRAIDQVDKARLLEALAPGATTLEEIRFSSIGPIFGQELARRGLVAIGLVLVLILLFVAFAFRKVSRPVSSWKYGLIALIALLHDLIIPTGVFAWLGAVRGVEIDALFLTGLLTIFGLSVHDTIVVFDRIREHLRNRVETSFAATVGTSLQETFTRSVNTSVTIILSLLVLYFFGAESTKWFSLLMAVGVFVGTYSSLFIASPLLVLWNKKS